MLRMVLLLSIALIFSSCKKDEIKSNSASGDTWLINTDEIIHFDSELDKIQSLDTLEFIDASSAGLPPETEVVAYKYDNIVRIYPMSVLESHEIINDSINNHYFSITHCPLTSSTIAWNRFINGKVNSFGVSGKLYRENLIPYDRNTLSHWSQMLNKCVNGENIGMLPETEKIVKTKFSTVLSSFPDAQFLIHTNCDSNSCNIDFKSTEDDPLGDGNDLISDDDIFLGIVKENSVALVHINENEKPNIKYFNVFGKNYFYYSSNQYNLHLIYETSKHSFTIVENNLPAILRDENGVEYDIFGNPLNSPPGIKVGSLKNTQAFRAHTFAFKSIYSNSFILK